MLQPLDSLIFLFSVFTKRPLFPSASRMYQAFALGSLLKRQEVRAEHFVHSVDVFFFARFFTCA